eukprot:355538_1
MATDGAINQSNVAPNKKEKIQHTGHIDETQVNMKPLNEMQMKFNSLEKAHEQKYDSSQQIDEEDEDYDKALPLPYDDGCFQKFKYKITSFLVIHPRIYALYLLWISTWPRALAIVDIYTDIVVAYELYSGYDRVWFFFSGLFIILPFVLVWSASLRFIQAKINTLFKKTNNSAWIHAIVNVFLLFYMFPLVGSFFIVLFEIYWVISDIFSALKAFILGTGLIDTEDRQVKAMKSYRRAVEVFAESVPQAILQLYIFIRLNGLTEISQGRIPINNALYISFIVSMVNLCYNFYRFKSDAQLHGMAWSEYALSVLQLAEIPTIKLVPRLPAIKKGYIEEVNFGGFKFDKQSLTPLLGAISSSKCRLKTIKMSIGSLSKLDLQSCKLLGSLLNNTGIRVLISRSSSLIDIKRLFEFIDRDKSGYLEQDEFLSAIKTLNCSIQNLSLKKKQRIFKQLAIRRLKKRDRVYFYDFFKTAASIEDSKFHSDEQFVFDLTQIEFPLHFIFQRIQQIISSKSNRSNTTIFQSNKSIRIKLINSFHRLYQFCEGFTILDQIETTVQNHIFFPIIDVMTELGTDKKYTEYKVLVSQLFDKLLKSNVLNDEFYLKRNQLFRHTEIQKQMKLDQYASHITKYLQSKPNIDGLNIFEYCFLYQNNHKPYQCKLFTRLLDVWLGKVNKYFNNRYDIESKERYLLDLITVKDGKEGELYHLFSQTQGFHVKDNNGITPLSYAAKYGLKHVVEFYVKYVFKILAEDNNCEWIRRQSYLHAILHSLIRTEGKTPSVDLFKLFLSSNIIDLQYVHMGKYIGQFIIICRDVGASASKDYTLKCLETLKEFNYNFADSLDLHTAASLNDVEAANVIINSCCDDEQSLETLLNAQNKQNYSPLNNAINNDASNMTKLLLSYHHLLANLNYNFFVDKFKPVGKRRNRDYREKRNKWIICLYQLVMESNGLFLNEIEEVIQRKISEEISAIYQQEYKRSKKHKNYNNVELMEKLKAIQQQIRIRIDGEGVTNRDSFSIQTLSTLRSYHHGKPFNNEDELSVISSDTIREETLNDKPNIISWKQNYLQAICDKQNNSCVGIKHVSLKETGIWWCVVDCIHACAILAILIAMKIGYLYQQYLSEYNSILFSIVIFWIISDFLTPLGIIRGNKILIILKLISLLIVNLVVVNLVVVMNFGVIEMILAIIENKDVNMLQIFSWALYLLASFSVVLFFGTYMLNIHSMIKYYKNGGINRVDTFELHEMDIVNNIYKIVNMEYEPALNGKFCRVILVLDENTYRVQFVNKNGTEVDNSLGVVMMKKSNLIIETCVNNLGNDVNQTLTDSVKTFENEQKQQNYDHDLEMVIKSSLQPQNEIVKQQKDMLNPLTDKGNVDDDIIFNVDAIFKPTIIR